MNSGRSWQSVSGISNSNSFEKFYCFMKSKTRRKEGRASRPNGLRLKKRKSPENWNDVLWLKRNSWWWRQKENEELLAHNPALLSYHPSVLPSCTAPSTCAVRTWPILSSLMWLRSHMFEMRCWLPGHLRFMPAVRWSRKGKWWCLVIGMEPST